MTQNYNAQEYYVKLTTFIWQSWRNNSIA